MKPRRNEEAQAHIGLSSHRKKIGNNRNNWNHLKIAEKISKKHKWRARHHGNTENSRTGHCAHAAESTDVNVQKVDNGK
jgi:ribosomal protein L14E/L6E/L27E